MKSKIIEFDSGLKAIVTEMKNYESVALNVCIHTGSADEDDSNRGISHLVEHMLFKGTTNRKSEDIINQLDENGIRVNAFTSKTDTVYHTKSINENLHIAMDILSDMLFNSLFDEKELKKEKKVIIEELKMYEDDAASVAGEMMSSNILIGTPFRESVGGSKESVSAITREDILSYIKNRYTADNIIISIAGDISEESAKEFINKYFEKPLLEGKLEKKKSAIKKYEMKDLEKSKTVVKKKDNEQATVFVAYRGAAVNSEEFKTADVIAKILGGYMSSRLFLNVREKRGLVYAIGAGNESFYDAGAFYMHFGTSPEQIEEALMGIREELDDIIENGVNERELNTAKINISSSLRMSMENTFAVSLKAYEEYIYNKRALVKEDLLREYDTVTKEEVNALAKKIFNSKYVISAVGKDFEKELTKYFK